jgi:hypothetical protein
LEPQQPQQQQQASASSSPVDALVESSSNPLLASIEAWPTGMHAHAARPAGNAAPKACTARSIVATS